MCCLARRSYGDRRGHLDQARVTAIYDRNARLYGAMEAPVERAAFERLRSRLFGDLHGRVLELGIGAGKNLRHAPRTGALQLVAIDPSNATRERARRRASDLGVAIELGLLRRPRRYLRDGVNGKSLPPTGDTRPDAAIPHRSA